jgi:hypothetical protein
MSLVPVMDIVDGRFVLRCATCKQVYDGHAEFNEHPCAVVTPVDNKEENE